MKSRIASLFLGLVLLAACGSTTSGVRSRGGGPIATAAGSTTRPRTTVANTRDTAPGTDPVTAGGTTPATTARPADTGAPATATGQPTDTIASVPPVFDFGTGKTPQQYDKKLQIEVDDIQAFWTNEFPKVFSKAYIPLKGKIFAGFPGRTDIPGCGRQLSVYEKDLKDNAFYCSEGDFLAYDDADLFPVLSKRLGALSLGIVLAHEWGHAIQARAGVPNNTATIKLEQQADCYAGAWSAHLARGENKDLPFADDEIKNALLALILVKDPAGSNPAAPGAHGSAFDRVGAFQDGFTSGTKKCSTYIDKFPGVLELPGDASFQVNGGNAPLDDPDKPALPDPNDKNKQVGIYGLLISDLPTFWTAQLTANGVAFTAPKVAGYDDKGPFPTCSTTKEFAGKPYVFCPDNNTLFFNRTIGAKFYNQFGDFAIGYLLSNGYGEAVQTTLKSPLAKVKRALLDDCLTGAYAANAAPLGPSTTVNIQAGDLDEAVQTAVSIGDNKSTDNNIGTGFQKIAAFRTGVLGGLTACNKQIAAG